MLRRWAARHASQMGGTACYTGGRHGMLHRWAARHASQMGGTACFIVYSGTACYIDEPHGMIRRWAARHASQMGGTACLIDGKERLKTHTHTHAQTWKVGRSLFTWEDDFLTYFVVRHFETTWKAPAPT
jgi:hypothetical protein